MSTGGQLLVDCLRQQGVDRIFCVPGESYLAVLDALHDHAIDVIVAKQEGGAAMMAEADAKLTGRPGICMVTRGPGATNASAGVHIAQQDSTPMILFIGQVGRSMSGRDAFQEMDYGQVFGSFAKRVFEISDADRIPEILSAAFHICQSGRPGPVVISLPEDMLAREHTHRTPGQRVVPSVPAPDAASIADVSQRLAESRRPFVILGGSRWDSDARTRMQLFAERWQLPVTCTFRRQYLFDHEHANYAGDLGIGPNPALLRRLKESDLLIMLGARLPEMPSQSYTLLNIPDPQTQLIHIHPGAEELGSVYNAAVGINATPGAFLQAMEDIPGPEHLERDHSLHDIHDDYLGWSTPDMTIPGAVQMPQIMRYLRDNAPDDSIMTNGAGNFSTWLLRFWRFRHFDSQLAPTSGSMGYGLPAAVAAKLRCPDRTVICFAGDGDWQMSMQEFGTACQYGAPFIALILDNGMYGTIRMHQEKTYPGRISATEIRNPDFATIAKAYGGFGAYVARTEDFAPAFEAAKASGKPSVIHLKIDPEAISPTMTIQSLRNTA